MAYGDYYNPNNKIVVPGAIVYADDINKINVATDAAFAQVASDLDILSSSGVIPGAKAWATADAGTRPDVLINDYSSKAYANEAEGWASSSSTVIAASTGLAIPGSVSAKTYANQAGVSASSASASASASLGYKTSSESAATTAITKAEEASASSSSSLSYKDLSQRWASELENSVVADGKYSAFHWAQKAAASAVKGASLTAIDSLTPAADKIPYFTGSTTASLTTITPAGMALIDDADSAAQRVTLGLGNVVNVNSQNADNLTSGTVADARIASTITRNTDVNTATQTALNLKANSASPTFTGTLSCSGSIRANHGSIHASGWNGVASDGLLFFGDTPSAHLLKKSSNFDFYIDGWGGSAYIKKAGTIAMTDSEYNIIGSLAFAAITTGTAAPGATISGASIQAASIIGTVVTTSGTALSGTWRCLGFGAGGANPIATLFQRIA